MEHDLRAKVVVTARYVIFILWQKIYLSISLNRELELIAGNYIEQTLKPDSRLWFLIQSAALNRTALQSQQAIQAFVATHT